jgi:hypothetical protein
VGGAEQCLDQRLWHRHAGDLQQSLGGQPHAAYRQTRRRRQTGQGHADGLSRLDWRVGLELVQLQQLVFEQQLQLVEQFVLVELLEQLQLFVLVEQQLVEFQQLEFIRRDQRY